VKVFVCTSCSSDGGFLDALHLGMSDVEVTGVECMSGCTRAQTVAFRSPGKVAYLFGDITAADMDDLRNFAHLYEASADGTFSDARVLGNLRTKAIARIPG
jgi:predicted metal-binding protein